MNLYFDKLNYYDNERGLWHELQVGISVGQSNSFTSQEAYPLIYAVSGYQFNQFLGIGLGTGYQSFSNINIVPIYVSLRGDLLNTRIAPFYYANLGYGIGVKKGDDFFFGDEEKAKGGLLLGSGFGVKFKFRRTFLTTSIGYKLQKSSMKREFTPIFFDSRFAPSGGESITEKRTYKRIEVKIGIGF